MKQRIFRVFMVLAMIMIIICPINAKADIPSVLSGANPDLQVLAYEIKEGSIEIGAEFKLEITVKNNNAYATAYNVACDVSTEDIGLRVADGEVNQNYFQSINGNETVKFTKRFYIDSKYPYENAKINFTFSYTGENGKEYTDTSFISPKINEACKLNINGISVPDNATLDSRAMISVKCQNSGELNLTNLYVEIEGDVQDSQKRTYLGEIRTGEELNKNIYVNFKKVGQQDIKLKFTYTDEAGREYSTEESVFSVDVVLKNSTSITSSDESTVSGKLVFVMIILVVGILYVIMRLLKSMKKGGKN